MTKWTMLLAVSAISVAGCAHISSKVPGVALESPQTTIESTKLDYDIVGETEGTAQINVLFGIPGNLFISHDAPGVAIQPASASRSGRKFSAVEKEAIYDALQKYPNSDGIIAVRTVNYEKRNFLVFQTRTATVKGKAIRIRPSK